LTARTLYRIGTSLLKDPKVTETELGASVERVADTGAVDGMIMDGDDNLYFTDLENNAVRCRHSDGTFETIVRDEQLQWPDSLGITDDNDLYITSSQIDRMPRFNNGTDKRILPYRYFRFWLGPFQDESSWSSRPGLHPENGVRAGPAPSFEYSR
jgi:sugar lactone lactonase YvrE